MASALHKPDFRMLLAGQFVSDYGRQLTIFSLPTIAILGLHAQTVTVTALTGCEFAVIPLLAMIAGVLVDRWRRRRTMILANVVRFCALSSIPIAAAFHILTVPQLFVTGFLVSVASLFFDTAYQPFLAFLVGREEYAEGNARMTMSYSVASALGNGSGGPIVQVLGGPLAIVANLCTYSIGTIALLRIRKPEPRAGRSVDRSFRREFREGLAIVYHDPLLRGLAFTSALVYCGGALIDAVLPLYVYRALHQTPLFLGTLLALASTGVLAGAVATRCAKRYGVLRVLPFAIATIAIGHVVTSIAFYPLLAVLLGRTIVAGAAPAYDMMVQTLATQRVADHELGRMNATMRTVTNSAIPFACTCAGLLSVTIGFRAVMLLGAGCCTAAFTLFFLLHSRSGKTRVCSPSTTTTYEMQSAA